ncbi:MAG: T9SS type A sorting domain-containing protein, partial [Ignavibacteria bacterium]
KLYAQNIPDNFTGVHFRYDSNNNSFVSTNPKRSNQKSTPVITIHHNNNVQTGGSYIRYYFTEPYGVGYYSAESGNGLYSSVGWSLSNERISLFGNLNSTALWDFPTYAVLTDYTDISDLGGLISAGVGNYIYALNRAGGIPVLTFNVQSYNNGTAGFTQITGRGDFLVGSSVRTDSSAILGFNISSNVPDWHLTIPAELMAMKLSGNDSLLIANTYSRFWVINTYSGQVFYSGLINPSSNDGSQSVQGISGDGSIIATINYDGFLTVYNRNGNTYNQLWQYQEQPGLFYNWMSSVDISYDGSMIAAGTLDFIADSTFDGKIKLFKTTNGAVPVWSYSGCGDQVSSVSFSKNGKILSAATWGNRYIGGPNLFVFKTTHPDSTPVFMLNSPGSFFNTEVSNDGQTVIASGKAVHARINGHGGTFYNVFIDTSDAPFGIRKENETIPNSFELYQNYPNPFNPATMILYQLPKAGVTKFSVFDMLGQEVKVLLNTYQQAGSYNIQFDAKDFPSGIYFYKIQSGDFSCTKKMTLIK